jgi:hypothetical protein
MQYVPPYGVSDPNAHYINGDPSQGIQGSIPPAAAFEEPMREIVGAISKSNIVPSDADLLQLAKAIRSQFLNYVEDTGSVNSLSVALDPPLAAYTKGLPLHVLIRNSCTGPTTIDGGAGRTYVKKMDGSDVGQGDLVADALVLMMYDGTYFQLVNFGGTGGGGSQTFNFTIPYVVDTGTPGHIVANFIPAVPQNEIVAGFVCGVKIGPGNTCPGGGPTDITINGYSPKYPLLPNGGGIVLQGDLAAGDVAILYFDGTTFYFAPNPFITAPVTYTVGPAQQFTTVPNALDAIKRKSIAAQGHVYLKIAATGATPIAPFQINHPDADRLTIQGTMIGANPVQSDFVVVAGNASQRDSNYYANLAMLRGRYGTELHIAGSSSNPLIAIQNTGPGMPTVQDLLITGTRLPVAAGQTQYWEEGVSQFTQAELRLQNVTVSGCQYNFFTEGHLEAVNCYSSGAMSDSWVTSGGFLELRDCGAYGGEGCGFVIGFGTTYCIRGTSLYNNQYGWIVSNEGSARLWDSQSYGNQLIDLCASQSSTIIFINGSFNTTSPALGVVGNFNSLVLQYSGATAP